MGELIGQYREAWRSAGHPGRGRVMIAFHMLCAEDRAEAVEIAREPLNRYLRTLVAAASDWTSGTSSADYPGYDKMVEALSRADFETQTASGAAWVGTPEDICDAVADYVRLVDGFDVASMQVNFNTVPFDAAVRSMRLFSARVMPRFVESGKAA